MGVWNFLIMMASFTGGISIVAFAIAGARRFAGGGSERTLRDLREEVELLRGEMERLRTDLEHPSRPAELDDIQNRLDFAERLLAQIKPRNALPGAS
ncbi:MAG: hypothetical protein ABR998_06850 [Gemmatimonadales bacterium]|jgi:hypothetical protein